MIDSAIVQVGKVTPHAYVKEKASDYGNYQTVEVRSPFSGLDLTLVELIKDKGLMQ